MASNLLAFVRSSVYLSLFYPFRATYMCASFVVFTVVSLELAFWCISRVVNGVVNVDDAGFSCFFRSVSPASMFFVGIEDRAGVFAFWSGETVLFLLLL